MNTKPSTSLKSAFANGSPPAGLKVRTGLRMGAWNCTNCQGQVSGNQLFKPSCGYCQPA
jgi:hypothetical protein